MVAVMTLITQFRINPDYRSQATHLLVQIIEALETSPPYSADQRFAWDMLERVANRFIGVKSRPMSWAPERESTNHADAHHRAAA